MTRMHEKLKAGQMALGTILFTSDAEWVETIAYAGLDYVMIDFMSSSADWQDAASLTRAARASGIASWLRISRYPFNGLASAPAEIAAASSRAVAIGADLVMASVIDAQETAALVHPAGETPRRVHIMRNRQDRTPAQAADDSRQEKVMMVAALEGMEAVGNLDAILDVAGLDAIFLAMGDLSRELTGGWDDRAPEVQRVVEQVVDAAAAKGVSVFSNVMAYAKPEFDRPEYVAEQVLRAQRRGIKAVSIPNPCFVVQRNYHRVVGWVAASSKGLRAD
jgi:2-keto-3-deoxy-L-rhamnonate aldolase RhmA